MNLGLISIDDALVELSPSCGRCGKQAIEFKHNCTIQPIAAAKQRYLFRQCRREYNQHTNRHFKACSYNPYF